MVSKTDWVVKAGDGRMARVVNAGPEDSMRKFIENNYPRLHVEPNSNVPPQPDAVLVSPSGDEEHFHGAEAGWKSPLDTAALAPFGATDSDADLQSEFLAWKQQQTQEKQRQAEADRQAMEAWRRETQGHHSEGSE